MLVYRHSSSFFEGILWVFSLASVSFFKFFNCETLFWNSDMIFFALSSINFKPSSLNFTSSAIMYLELLYISSKVLALFLRNVRDILILSSLFEVIFFLYLSRLLIIFSRGFSFVDFISVKKNTPLNTLS
mgnify:CR=1 FL=1